MYWNGKVDSLQGWTLPKIRITSKKASKKSCLELNFVQKSPQAHISIFPQSGARWLGRLMWLKYYIILKLQMWPDTTKGANLHKTSFHITWLHVFCEEMIHFSWNLVVLLVDAFCIILRSAIFFVFFLSECCPVSIEGFVVKTAIVHA